MGTEPTGRTDGAVVLDDEHQHQFAERGYTVVPSVFAPDECHRITGLIEAADFELLLGAPDDGQLSYRPMLHLASPELQAVACDRRWAGIVLPLLGGSARLYWEQCVAKPPHATTELPWHQDNGYTPLLPEQYVTCWLALDDADESNGCIWVLPGSHHGGTRPHRNGGTGPFRVGHEADDAGVPVPVHRGDVLVFSSLVMHRSGPNRTDQPRRAWILQYCPEEARSALSGKLLDDRLLVGRDGRWLVEPTRARPFDLLAVLANYDQR